MYSQKREFKKIELPEIKEKNEFDYEKFLKLAKEVKDITDKEKKEGFLVDEYTGNSRFSY